MSERTRILAVDAGNSRVKWAMYEGDACTAENSCATGELKRLDEYWSVLDIPAVVVISNVAGDVVGTHLTRGCEALGRVPTWIKAQACQCGVSNAYDDPAQLGSDRWAALIGAYSLSPGNCVVVCMGTATTIDALTGAGDFLGGMILPGFDMMHASLATNTARLGAERGRPVVFPHSTRDAITTGAVRATCGAIRSALDDMKKAGYDDITVIGTGGAAPIFSTACGFPMVLREKLVLDGLARIGQTLTGTGRE